MAFTCGFFNSENGDRKYNAEQISAIFDGIIADGVFATIGDHMVVTPGTGMKVLVGTGKAWFDHTWNVNDSLYSLEIAKSDVTLDRIDAVVLETNHSDSVRFNGFKVITGSPAADPAKPVLTNTELIHQHPLAWVRVKAGATSITASMIENAVGKSECPFVTGVVEVTNIDDIFNQWQGEFEEWFANLKTQLSGDVAANLQRQIDALSNEIDQVKKDAVLISNGGSEIIKRKFVVPIKITKDSPLKITGNITDYIYNSIITNNKFVFPTKNYISRNDGFIANVQFSSSSTEYSYVKESADGEAQTYLCKYNFGTDKRILCLDEDDLYIYYMSLETINQKKCLNVYARNKETYVDDYRLNLLQDISIDFQDVYNTGYESRFKLDGKYYIQLLLEQSDTAYQWLTIVTDLNNVIRYNMQQTSRWSNITTSGSFPKILGYANGYFLTNINYNAPDLYFQRVSDFGSSDNMIGPFTISDYPIKSDVNRTLNVGLIEYNNKICILPGTAQSTRNDIIVIESMDSKTYSLKSCEWLSPEFKSTTVSFYRHINGLLGFLYAKNGKYNCGYFDENMNMHYIYKDSPAQRYITLTGPDNKKIEVCRISLGSSSADNVTMLIEEFNIDVHHEYSNLDPLKQSVFSISSIQNALLIPKITPFVNSILLHQWLGMQSGYYGPTSSNADAECIIDQGDRNAIVYPLRVRLSSGTIDKTPVLVLTKNYLYIHNVPYFLTTSMVSMTYDEGSNAK